MSNTLYRDAIARYARSDWASVDVRCLLLDPGSTYVFDATHQYVADLTPGSNEFAGANYARVAVAATAPTWFVGGAWRFLLDTPVFPTLGTAEVITEAVFYEHVTDDSDSLLISHHSFTGATLDGTDFTVNLPSGGHLFGATSS